MHPPLSLFCGRVLREKQVTIDSFKHCGLTITIYLFVKAQQALYRFRPRLAKGIVLIQAVCQEKQDPSDTFEGLTHTYLPKKLMKSDHDLEKIR